MLLHIYKRYILGLFAMIFIASNAMEQSLTPVVRPTSAVLAQEFDGLRARFQGLRKTSAELTTVEQEHAVDRYFLDQALSKHKPLHFIKNALWNNVNKHLEAFKHHLNTLAQGLAEPEFQAVDSVAIRSQLAGLSSHLERLDQVVQRKNLSDLTILLADIENRAFLPWWRELKSVEVDLDADQQSPLTDHSLDVAIKTKKNLSWVMHLAQVQQDITRPTLAENVEVLSGLLCLRAHDKTALEAFPRELDTESKIAKSTRKIKAMGLSCLAKTLDFPGSRLIAASRIMKLYSARQIEQVLCTILSSPVPVPYGASYAVRLFEIVCRDSQQEYTWRQAIAQGIIDWAVALNVVTELSVVNIKQRFQRDPNLSYAEMLKTVEQFIRTNDLQWFIDKCLIPYLRFVRRSAELCGWNSLTALCYKTVGEKLTSKAESLSYQSALLNAEDEDFSLLQKTRTYNMVSLLQHLTVTDGQFDDPQPRTMHELQQEIYDARPRTVSQTLTETVDAGKTLFCYVRKKVADFFTLPDFEGTSIMARR